MKTISLSLLYGLQNNILLLENHRSFSMRRNEYNIGFR